MVATRGARSIITALTAAILAAATPCLAGSWDDFAGSVKKDKAAAQRSAQLDRARGLKSMLMTENAKAADRIRSLFAGEEKRMRGLCAPDFSSGAGAAPGEMEAFKSVIEQYKAGKVEFWQAAFAAENLKASIHRYMSNDQTAFVEQQMLNANSKQAIAQNASAERGRFIQGQYVGSSIGCNGGNGTIVWDQSEIATFRDERAWKVEKVEEGRLRKTYVALDNGGYNVTLEYGSFSATVVLMLPGQNLTANKIRAAAEEYNAALRAAYEAKGIDPNVSNWQAMKEGYNRGDSPEQLKQAMRDRYTAGAEAIPQMLNLELAVKDAQLAQIQAEADRADKERERRQTGGVQIQDAPFKIIALNLDSSRERSLSEKDAAVRQNQLIQHAEEVYRAKSAKNGDIVTFLSLILETPELRQQIAR